MTDKFKELLKLLIEEYALNIHKAPNYTDTYTRKFLISKFIPEVIETALYNHCIEISVDKHKVHDDYAQWIKQLDVDRKEEELDRLYKLEPYSEYKFTEEDVEKYQRLPKKSLKKLRKKQGLE
jgi:hypothetical protein